MSAKKLSAKFCALSDVLPRVMMTSDPSAARFKSALSSLLGFGVVVMHCRGRLPTRSVNCSWARLARGRFADDRHCRRDGGRGPGSGSGAARTCPRRDRRPSRRQVRGRGCHSLGLRFSRADKTDIRGHCPLNVRPMSDGETDICGHLPKGVSALSVPSEGEDGYGSHMSRSPLCSPATRL
jgi:hypothetical protein